MDSGYYIIGAVVSVVLAYSAIEFHGGPRIFAVVVLAIGAALPKGSR